MFEKLFDKFTSKRRYFVVRESNMIEVFNMIKEALYSNDQHNNMSVGNCGWVDEPDKWFVHINLTNLQWRALLNKCKDKHYKLVIEDIPDRMCFTKIEES